MEGAVPAASRRTRIYTSRLDDKLRARGERTEFLATFFHESAAIIHDRLNFRAHPHVTSHSPPDKLTPINNDRFFTDRKLISICSPIIYFELSLSLPFLDPFASVISPIQYFEPIDGAITEPIRVTINFPERIGEPIHRFERKPRTPLSDLDHPLSLAGGSCRRGAQVETSATCGRKWGSSVPRRYFCPPPRQNVIAGEGEWVIHGLRLTVDKPAAHWFGRRLEITDRAFTVYFSRVDPSRLYPSPGLIPGVTAASIDYLVLS